MAETRTYTGLLSLNSYGEEDEILYLSTLSDPVVEELEYIHFKNVTLRYWVNDKQATKEAGFIGELLGNAKVNFGARYSEDTGYLWTNEHLNIGGHDLINELRSYVGKWLILEISVKRREN